MISERQKFIEDDINRTLPLTIDKLDDLRNKSLLITGAGGFLGSWLIQLINFLNHSFKLIQPEYLTMTRTIGTGWITRVGISGSNEGRKEGRKEG